LLLGSGQPSLVWVWKISPKNPKKKIFFALQVKKNLISAISSFKCFANHLSLRFAKQKKGQVTNFRMTLMRLLDTQDNFCFIIQFINLEIKIY